MLQLLWLSLLVAAAHSRTVRVRPVAAAVDQDTRQVEYYAEQPEEDDGPILVSRQDTYGRANGQARVNPRFKPESAKQPPVQTIRNYNKLNDDGSFTFGYEAADGSFKEETRGTDCVVRGKYGYIDPDGNKREFSYVSGNPCDPNAVQQEEEERPLTDSGEENIPANANIPLRRPVSRPRPPSQPTTTFFQNYNSVSSNEEEEDEENIPARAPVRTTARARPVTSTVRPTTVAVQPPSVYRGSPTPKAAFGSPTPRTPQAVRITPRPATVEPATTYRPQLLEVSASPTPTTYSKQVRPTALSNPSTSLDFDEEFKKFQLENNVVSSTSRPSKQGGSDAIYSTELVFDPSSGQYNTVLYQALPHNQADVNLRQRLQPFVDTPYQPNPFLAPQPLQYQQQQHLFQQNQAQLLQQSQQLFAQQQRKQKPVSSQSRLESSRPQSQSQSFPPSLLQQEPQTFQPSPSRSPTRAAPTPIPAATRYSPFPPPSHQGVQSFYYVNPQANSHNNLAAGQIDAFLRGHSLQI